MKTIKVNFTISEETAARLKLAVAEGRRSGFVEKAIEEKLDRIEREQFLELMKEGYLARRQEDVETDQVWEVAALEGWPEEDVEG